MFFKVGLILLLVKFSLQASTPESPFYEAAVVEFAYETNPTYNQSQLLNSNLRQYLEIMMSAPQNLDIIVFPEMTLNAMSTAVEISEPSQKIIPCDNGNYTTENLVKQISCSAKHFQRYVVVNIVTKVNCPDPEMIANNDKRNCSSRADGFSYYNTNVVFDRKGEIISRYRKFNLFGESVDKPKRPALVTFVTDFGVTFGTFICFDLMFKRPALELIRNSNITDIVFTSMWFSEMPFLTGVQAQQNWAFANNVNLLAAGANNPLIGSTGSGIYAARYGSLTSIMQGISQSQILTATVPKRTNFNSNVVRQATRFTPEHMRSLKLKRDQLDRYTSNLNVLQLGPNASWNYTVVHNNVSCVFRLRYTMRFEPNTKPYEFRVAAYDGNRTFDGFADGGVATCAIFACLNGTLSSCGIRDASYQSNIDWHSIEIVATMPNDDNGGYFYMPTTLDSSIMPLSTQDFIYSVLESDANRTKIVMTSSRELNDFLTFGIYGRNFNLDDDDDESDSAALRFSSLLIAVSILAIFNA